MRAENKTFKEWWNEVGALISYGDMVIYDEDDEGNETAVFLDSTDCELSRYEFSKQRAVYK